MKKLLAMVLALVMTLSLAVSANAAFKDDKSISDDYAEAVAVLNGMGVFKGYEDNSFKPEGNITRAEVATIIYRIYTADVAKNDKSGLYATYNKFSDMAGASWAAGYIGYCANASLVKGYPDGTFKPSGNVTGYEVLAMILRAVGYDKNNEFSGADWALHVAQTAQQLGVLDNVAKTTDLNAPASRELVAELLFQGIQKAQVTYTPAFGYVTDKVIGAKNNSLGEKNFKLASAAASDKWGRPATKWTYNTGDKATTFVEKPDLTYTKAVAECDVAHDAGLKKDTAYTVYVNGHVLSGGKYTINLTDTTTKIGAQGRLTEVYDDTIVMIDTFLAKVNSVADAAYDAQGHLRKEASIDLTVYDAKTGNTANYVLYNGETNYGYAKDEYVLLNAYTAQANNTVKASDKVEKKTGSTNDGVYGEIVDKATSIEGAQSVIYWKSQQHNVAGTVYDDAAKFLLDQAGTSLGNYTWFFDQYGNLIGDVEIAAATSYGVITRLWWAGTSADGTGVAKANVTYMDGTTAQVDISSMTYDNVDTLTSATVADYDAKTGTPFHYTAAQSGKLMTVDTLGSKNYFFVDDAAYTNEVNDSNDIINGHLFQFTTKNDGTVKAVEVSGNKNVGYEKFASIYSAVSKDTLYSVATNNSTLFLVRSENTDGTYKYESITGINNIGNYAADEVDYVDLNGDRVADYVFVIGESVAAKAEGLFYYAGNNNYSYDASTGYWTIGGFMDGEAATIKVKNPNFFNETAGFDATAAAEVNALTGTDGALYYVKTDDGVYVTGSKYAYTANQSTTNFADARTDVYNDSTDVKVSIFAGASGDSAVSGLLSMSHNDFITNGNTKYVVDGAKAEALPSAISDYNVIVVWNSKNAETKGLALQVYAMSKSTVAYNARPITKMTVTVPTISNTTYASAAVATSASVPSDGYGTVTGANENATATLKVLSTSWARWDVAAREWVAMGDYEPFVSGTSYQYTITVGIDTMSNGVCVITATNPVTGVLVCG